MNNLVRVIQDLSKVRSLPEIISIVRTAARRMTGADGATFVLRDSGFCFYADEDAIGPLWKGKRFPMSACISGWAMLNKKPVAIPDVFDDPRVPVEAYRPTFVKSLAMMPVRRFEPIAAIGIYWAKKHRATELELAILQALADTTSVAIENVNLYNSLQERIRELEAAHKIKDEFLMLISHELRTPLNSIMGWSEMLVIEEGADKEPFLTGLQAIHRNSKLQCRVVDRLLDASYITLGRFEIQKDNLNFLTIVEAVMVDAELAASKRRVQLVFEDKTTCALMLGDGPRLRQMVESLIDNAVKFSSEGGVVKVTLEHEGPSVCMRVRDEGVGIEDQAQSFLFNRFSQTENYLTRSHGGLGLGLTIARSIIEAHHGQIEVFSAGLGQGAEFKVSLPLHSSRAQEMPQGDAALTPRH